MDLTTWKKEWFCDERFWQVLSVLMVKERAKRRDDCSGKVWFGKEGATLGFD